MGLILDGKGIWRYPPEEASGDSSEMIASAA
jgi:hypothetical protein